MDKMKGQDVHYLKFYAEGHHLLIDVFNVHSIVAEPKVISITQAPAYVQGLIVVEGSSVPLLHTGKRLNMLKNVAETQFAKVIVSIPSDAEQQEGYLPIAFTTDDIDDVIIRNTSELQPLPTEEKVLDDRLFDGTYQVDDELLFVLNVDNFYKENFDEILTRNTNN